MFEPRTLKIFALMVGGFVLLCIPAYAGPRFLEEASAMLVMVPALSIYVFHALGSRSASFSWRRSGCSASGCWPEALLIFSPGAKTPW
jgi:hypothetical protein